MSTDKTTDAPSVGSTDESIGRPAPWREGRYQRQGERIDQSVNQPSETPAEPHDTVGTQTPPSTGRANKPKAPGVQDETPVTLKDYE